MWLVNAMTRKKLTPNQKAELREANKSVCCVCKERGVGINFHHIDHDSSNNDPSNIAVLCVKDHDAHHRPDRYEVNHADELSKEEIRQHKQEWEDFVGEAKKSTPSILAVLNIYGTEEDIHSLRLVFQWETGEIVLERVYHLVDSPPDKWIDEVIDEVKWLGDGINISVIDKPLDVEYCPCCENSLARTIDPGLARKITTPDWEEKSLMSVYVNPSNPSLALLVSYENEEILQGALHKCGENHLHLQTDDFQERVPIRDDSEIRIQAKEIVYTLIRTWDPGEVIVGTGNPDAPDILDEFELPEVWES